MTHSALTPRLVNASMDAALLVIKATMQGVEATRLSVALVPMEASVLSA